MIVGKKVPMYGPKRKPAERVTNAVACTYVRGESVEPPELFSPFASASHASWKSCSLM
jgi:hypothetical protein